ncbi:hypothetical protein [Allomesorhizobium alhagi]|uniref:hypothetical protein n=1 Tax=Allomesorhizobium alhagi TaxID=475067 RepID=UPI001930D380|nr:hypothetical protein [Mesorhizobium alhagi]
MFKAAALNGIRNGRITLAFRRWRKPTVHAGGTLRTPAGVLAFDDVREIAESEITNDDAKAAGFENRETLIADLRSRTDGATYRIAFHLAGGDPRAALREIEDLASEDVAELESALAKLDRSRGHSPWTIMCLRLVGEAEGRPAGELAERLGFEKQVLKRKIRQLKELGLTESLQVGYRLSKRGRALLKHLSSR